MDNTPFIMNWFPNTPAEINSLISLDILDDYGINLSKLDAYVDGNLIFSGPSTFFAPYNGSITPTNISGYDGYHLELDCTDNFEPNRSYIVRLVCYDNFGNILDESHVFRTTLVTYIKDVYQTFKVCLNLIFSTPMIQDYEFSNTANYTLNNNTYVRKVDIIDEYGVQLWVELLARNKNYTVTVSPNVKNTDNKSLYIDSYDFFVSESDASFSNYNDMVRTWHESNFIHADSQRIYLAGSKGIDVFRKKTPLIYSQWAQIFDSYNISAMCISNFNGDYQFIDIDPPYFSYQNPYPGFTVSPYSIIYINIEDAVTSIDLKTLKIYLNELTVFNSGWKNGFSGSINIGYKYIEISFLPPEPLPRGVTLEVRVIVNDLMDNILDTSYVFYARITDPSEDGFGVVKFGTSEFGK